jgi:hypothetical protein
MGPTCCRFFRPKNSTALAGCEPANLGTKGPHSTSRPPKPLYYDLVTLLFLQVSCGRTQTLLRIRDAVSQPAICRKSRRGLTSFMYRVVLSSWVNTYWRLWETSSILLSYCYCISDDGEIRFFLNGGTYLPYYVLLSRNRWQLQAPTWECHIEHST